MIDDLQALADKYRELAALRARREETAAAGAPFGLEELAARRRAFRAVAERFPGALRELDCTSAAALRDKALAVEDEIARVRDGLAVSRRWVLVVVDFHHTLRRLLAAKRGGAGRAPGGRIMNVVWEELERRHGLRPAELREAVFGTPEGSPPDRRS